MLDATTKRRIDDARDILVGKIPDPKSQVEQITIALIYKFMDDMDTESEELGGSAKFFVGDYKKYSWRKVFNKTRGGQEIINDYRLALQEMSKNPSLPTIFHTIFRQAYLPYNDPETLKEFLKIIDQFDYDHSEKLGDAFEYLLSVLGSQGDAGQFRTPRHIIDFMVELVEPKKGETILDPACGTAGFLISAYKYILKHNSSEGKDKGDLLSPDERKRLSENISGYDISPDMVRLSLVNMYLHKITEPKITEYDTLTSDTKWNEYFDVVLANPPFMSPKGGIKPHSRFSVQSKRSEALFVDYIAEHLTITGRGAVIVPEGVIFKSDTAFTKLRKMLVEDHYLYGVISLPSGVFNPYSGVKTSILLFDKVIAKLTDKILFAKVENDGFGLGAQRRPVEGSQLEGVASAIKDFKIQLHRGEEFESNVCTFVEKSKIAESGDYNLSGERYENGSRNLSSTQFVKLGDICTFSQGVQVAIENQFSVKSDGQIRFLRIIDFTQGEQEARYVNKPDEKYIIESDDIAMVRYGATGFVCTGLSGVIANNMFKISPLDLNVIYRKYLYYILKSNVIQYEIKKQTQGVSMPAINFGIIKSIEIPLPPIEEQRAIVADIEGYQKIIDAARTIADNYRPQITIDPSWQMVELGEAVDKSLIGLIKSKAEQDEAFEHRYLKMDAIDNRGNIDLSKSVRVNATEEELEKYSLQDGDYIYNTRNAPNLVGKSAVFKNNTNERYLFNNNLLRIRFKKDMADPMFVNVVMNSDYGKLQLNKYIDGTTSVAAIYQKNYFMIEIPLPALETQQQIVAEIEREQAAVDSAKELIEIFTQKITNRIAQIWNE